MNEDNTKSNESSDNSFIKPLIQHNTKFFENSLISSIIRSKEFWKSYCLDKINVRIDPQSRINKNCYEDFSSSIDNDIYECVNEYYSAYSDNESVTEISVPILQSMFSGKIEENKMFSQDLDFLNDRIASLNSMLNCEEKEFKNNVLRLAEDGFSIWLEFRRVHQISHINRNKNIDADEMISQLKSAVTKVKSFDVDVMEVDDAIESEESKARMPISTMPILTKIMGGGVMKGEPGLIVTGSGGGKTIISSQIAQGLAANLYTVVFYTTEQHANKIVPRMVSAATGIPFMYIKDGIKDAINKNVLSKTQLDQIQEWAALMKGKLFFENWCNNGFRIKTHLEKSVKWYKENKNIDAIVFDWLGGGVEFAPSGDNKKTEYYNYNAKLFVDVCKMYDVFGLITAQINPKQAEKISHITINEVDSSKTLDQYLTWAAGISSIPENVQRAATSLKTNYKRQQTFNIWKNRLGSPTSYPVIREFEFQRFVEKENVLTSKIEQTPIVLDDIYQGDGKLCNI